MSKNTNKVEKTKSSLYMDLIFTSLMAVVVAIIIVIAVVFVKKMDNYEKAVREAEERYDSWVGEEQNSNFEIILEE